MVRVVLYAEMGGEHIIIHNNAHSVIWKEQGNGCMFVIRLVVQV